MHGGQRHRHSIHAHYSGLERDPGCEPRIPFSDSHRRRYVTEIRIIDVALRITKVRVVEHIEDLGPQLEFDAFRDLKCLKDPNIRVSEIRPPQKVSLYVAKYIARFRSPSTIRCAINTKHRAVKIRIPDSDTTEDSNIRNELIWILPATRVVHGRGGTLDDTEWRSAHHTNDRIDLPSADQGVNKAVIT